MSNPGWSLEVVRGREVGRVYALHRGEIVLGNALDGAPGLDLAHQEGDSPRRMAGRQARLDWSGQGLTLRDLDSPGGTFVNRQRLLPGQVRALQPGDVIQLGGVQLKVVAGVPAPTPRAAPAPRQPALKPKPQPAPARPSPASPEPAQSGPLPAPFVLKSGATCRTWDDFLTVSAQRWDALRDELNSGRLAAFLVAHRRGALAPSPHAPGTPDERLDAWLATLPTTRPSRPELEVHPAKLTVRAVPGGGVTRQSVQITNIGYRLLRSTVRVEPPSASWVQVAPEFTRAPFITVEQTDLPVEVRIPETLDAVLSAALVIDSNGGTRRVDVLIERPPAPELIPEADAEAVRASHAGEGLLDLIARQPPAHRLVTWGAGALALRLLIVLADALVGAGESGSGPAPGLRGPAVLFALTGGALAALATSRRGEPRNVPAVACAGGFAGLLAASLMVAACRTIEPLMGPLAASPIAVCLLWTALGAGLAATSVLLVRDRHEFDGKKA